MSKIKSVNFYIQIPVIPIPYYIKNNNNNKKHYLQKHTHTCRSREWEELPTHHFSDTVVRHGTCLVSFITAVKHLKAFHLHKEAELRQLPFVYWN